MGATSLPAAAPRRRSFNLPSFRRPSAAARQEDDLTAKSKSVEEVARIQKAAAWQWHTRGVGDALAPTQPARRPPLRNPQASDQSCIDGSRAPSSNMPQKKTMEPPLAEFHRDASRFKLEAGLKFTSGGAPPALPAPSGGPSTPLYDELELSSLRTHMADFVQHLHPEGTPPNEQSSTAVGVDHGKSRPLPPSVNNDLHHSREGAGVASVVSAGDLPQQLPTFLSSSAPPVASASIPFHKKPFSALQKLFRKVLSGSVPKCTKNSPQVIVSAPAVYGNPVGEPAEVLYDDVNSTNQYHHHHYIHHHHHHYHFSKTPEEQSSTIFSRRRHSESGSSRPCTPNLVEAGSDEKEDQDEAEESRFAAYLARRRRRHSDTFSRYQLLAESAGSDKDEKMKEETAKGESGMEFSRRYSSERFWVSKIPTMAGKDNIAQPVEFEDEFDEGAFAGIRSRRRHSAERQREEPSLERTGGKSAGGAYVLGGGAGAGGGTQASMPTGRRRHSESSKERPEAPSPGWPYWTSPSARYYKDGQERHIVTAGLNAGLPPLYPY